MQTRSILMLLIGLSSQIESDQWILTEIGALLELVSMTATVNAEAEMWCLLSVGLG